MPSVVFILTLHHASVSQRTVLGLEMDEGCLIQVFTLVVMYKNGLHVLNWMHFGSLLASQTLLLEHLVLYNIALSNFEMRLVIHNELVFKRTLLFFKLKVLLRRLPSDVRHLILSIDIVPIRVCLIVSVILLSIFHLLLHCFNHAFLFLRQLRSVMEEVQWNLVVLALNRCSCMLSCFTSEFLAAYILVQNHTLARHCVGWAISGPWSLVRLRTRHLLSSYSVTIS